MSSSNSLDQKEQAPTSPMDASKAIFATIKKIDTSVLEKMVVYNFPGDNTMTVANFSKGEQKVLLMFLRHFNCIICQATICKVAANYKSLLQLNTVPVLVHQETQECADKFLTHPMFKNYQPLVKNLLRVSDPQGNFLYKRFNLGKVTPAKSNAIKGYPTLREFNRLGFYNSIFTQERRASTWQMPGVFLVEKAKIQNVFEYQFVNSNPLIIDLIVDPEEKGYCVDSFCDLTGSINKFIPKMEGTDTRTVSNEEQLKGEETISAEEQKENVVRTFSKMVDPYSTVETKSSSASLFSCQTRLQEDVIPEDIKKSISLDTVLNNKKALKLFKVFCASEYSLENILFYEAVQMYKNNLLIRVVDENDIAKKIMKAFFEKGSPNALNTSMTLIKKCQQSFDENGAKEDLFDEIVKTVLSEQLLDTFKRFKKNESFDKVARVIMSQSS